MRPASKNYAMSWVFAALLSTPAAFAAPTITDWSYDTTSKGEVISLTWDEVGDFSSMQFSQANEVVVILPGAKLSSAIPTRLAPESATVLDRARIQEVTLTSGETGIQVRLQLNQWTEAVATATDGNLNIYLPSPEAATIPGTKTQVSSALNESSEGGLVLTDDQIAKLDSREFFGAIDAPAGGAGQSPEAAESAINRYWVPPSVSPESAAGGSGESMGNLSVNSKLNEMVRRVDFQGTSLENVLRLVMEEAELNVLIRPSDVAGRTVTLRLRNVTLRQMLEAILKQNDLGYTIEDGGIIRIVPRNQVKSTLRETVTQTIQLNWIDAEEVRKAIEPFLDEEDGVIEISRATNLLIIRDVPENVSRVLDLVAQMDQAEKQVLIEMRLVNMTESARRVFGTRTGFNSVSEETRRVFDGDGFSSTAGFNSSTSTSSSSGTNSSFSDDLIGGLTGASGSNSSTSNASSSGTNFAQTLGSIPANSGALGLLPAGAEAARFANRSTISLFGSDFDVDLEISAQEERGEAVTLANPSVLSLNNTPAMVEISRQIPYVSGVNTDQGSIGTIEFVEVGTTINILPRITNHGWVQMTIAPEQIIDTGDRPQGVPLTDERRVEASVIVRDEQSVSIGGLRSFESTSAEAGVPYLLRVPVFSWLFKRQENTQNKTELYLFVTPHIIKDPNPTPYQMAIYDKIDYNWDLPDWYFDEVTARKSPIEESEDPYFKKGQEMGSQ